MLICAKCGEEFEPTRDETWSEEKALEELKVNFPDANKEDCVVVCDDCWKIIKPARPLYKGDY